MQLMAFPGAQQCAVLYVHYVLLYNFTTTVIFPFIQQFEKKNLQHNGKKEIIHQT